MDTPVSRRPDLALLLPSLAAGGVGRMTLNLAAGFVARGLRVDLVLCRPEGPYMDAIPDGVRLVTLQRESGPAARLRLARLYPREIGLLARPALLAPRPAPVQPYVADLARYLAEYRPASLLAAKTRTNLLALWARHQSGLSTRVVLSEHTQLSRAIAASRKWRWRYIAPLVGRYYPEADAVVSVSEGVGDDLAATAGLPRGSITTIHNPVVTPALAERAASPSPHPWFSDGGPPVVVAAGRLVAQKNFPLLLDAFARLRAGRAARLVILGEGPERGQLEAQARALGINADVALPGQVKNPYAAFARAALFTLSSDFEGLPTVLIEALACGCPVVSTDCPSGPAEILDHGRHGPLVPLGDAPALATAMAAVLDDPPPAEAVRARGQAFGQERSIARHLDILGLTAIAGEAAATANASGGAG
ncbi:Glycosyltransferase Gtf1 [wastewater metagenome]|uniref:Glycosyltransferase Gtf1 n=2 Tax=unclassified sequences TaxID=12908 RepID=A0A5B8RGX6_9ZZZZ|nr:glycosyltransferase [Arhodomonas sp. KWT]QEA07148.1 glycosyltransferase Gtf1 [uncultured organism]